MESAKRAAELRKIIKYWKNGGNLAIVSIILMAAFGTKNVHSVIEDCNDFFPGYTY